LFFFVLILNTSQILVGACTFGFGLPITVYVVNNLPSNSPLLDLRCQSGDDDLGNKTLRVNENFHWTFCQNFLEEHCSFVISIGDPNKEFLRSSKPTLLKDRT
ncbi:hypothetical protein PHJA_002500300, partial [Phtheirospermum japonicum]